MKHEVKTAWNYPRKRKKKHPALGNTLAIVSIMMSIFLTAIASSTSLTGSDGDPGRIFMLKDAAEWSWSYDFERSISYIRTPLMND